MMSRTADAAHRRAGPLADAMEDGVLRWLSADLSSCSNQTTGVLASRRYSERVRQSLGEASVDVRALADSPPREPLALPSDHYDRLYVFGVTRIVADRDLQREVHRTLRRQGDLLLVAPVADFAFAPLPAGGDFHLLKRALNPIWFDTALLTHRGSDFIAISARRKSHQ